MYIHVVYCLEFTTAYSSVGTDVRFLARRSVGAEAGNRRRRGGTPAREGAVWGLPETDAGFLLEQWCDIEITKVGNMAVPSHRLQGLWGAASQRNLGGGVDVQFMMTVTAACETKWCPPVGRTSWYRTISGTNGIGAWSGMWRVCFCLIVVPHHSCIFCPLNVVLPLCRSITWKDNPMQWVFSFTFSPN